MQVQRSVESSPQIELNNMVSLWTRNACLECQWSEASMQDTDFLCEINVWDIFYHNFCGKKNKMRAQWTNLATKMIHKKKQQKKKFFFAGRKWYKMIIFMGHHHFIILSAYRPNGEADRHWMTNWTADWRAGLLSVWLWKKMLRLVSRERLQTGSTRFARVAWLLAIKISVS